MAGPMIQTEADQMNTLRVLFFKYNLNLFDERTVRSMSAFLSG